MRIIQSLKAAGYDRRIFGLVFSLMCTLLMVLALCAATFIGFLGIVGLIKRLLS